MVLMKFEPMALCLPTCNSKCEQLRYGGMTVPVINDTETGSSITYFEKTSDEQGSMKAKQAIPSNAFDGTKSVNVAMMIGECRKVQ